MTSLAADATTTVDPDVPLASSSTWRTVTFGAAMVSRSAAEPEASRMTEPTPQPNSVHVSLMVSGPTR